MGKLTHKDVIYIREATASGVSGRALAAELGTCYTNVRKVLNGKSWAFELPINVGGDTIVSPLCSEIMVDRDGGVFRLSGRRLKPSLMGNGYMRVSSYVDGKKDTALVHRLVAAAFCAGFNPVLYVNHINGIKTDNRAENLEWVTPMENSRHAASVGLCDSRGEVNPKAKLRNADVIKIRKEISNGAVLRELARQYDVSPRTIWGIKNGAWKHI